MSLNLIDQFKGLLTDAILEKVAGNIGGDASAIQKGLTAAGSSVLASAMSKASTQEGAQGLFDMLGDGSSLANISDQLGEGSDLLTSGAGLAKSLLGDKASGVLSLIGKESGLDEKASSSILSLGSGLIGGILGQQKAAGGTVGSLVSLLAGQGSLLEKLFPSLAGILGLGSLAGLTDKLSSVGDLVGGLGDAAANVVGGATDLAGDAADKVGDVAGAVGGAALGAGGAAVDGGKSLFGKLLPLGILALLGIGLFTLLKSCNPADKVADVTSGAVEMAGDAANVVGDAANATVDAAGNVANATVDAAAGAVDATTDAAGAVVDAAGDAANATVDAAGDAANATVDAAAGAVDATADAAGAMANAAGDAANATVDATKDAAGAVADVAGNAAGAVGSALNAFGDAIGKLFSFDLPNGEKISIPEGGFEDSFLNALKDGNLSANKFYVFDRLFFASGSDALNAESNEQIANAAKILKAYPDLKVLLRGHTDSQGNAALNQKLSEDRAASVKNAIVALGVAADRINTQGLASSEPLADNDTADGRQRNRRIDISAAQ